MIEFTVYGEPIPQGSVNAMNSKTTGRAFPKMSNETKWRKWRKAVNRAACQTWGDRPPTDEPILVEVEFYFGPAPKARQGEVYCSTKIDGDKLMRAICDGITALQGKKPQHGITTNDSRVVRGAWIKYWCDSEEDQRAVIRINGLSRDLNEKSKEVSTLPAKLGL